MPESTPPPVIQEANLEAEPLKVGTQSLSDAYALSVVNNTFTSYEWFRSQNHDPRWNAHDALYTGWLPPKTWDGTTVPRSSLGLPITFGQIESAFPAIYQAIFVDDMWFQVAPEPGAQAQEAQAIQAHLKYALEHSKADFTGTAEVELELSIKQILQHGNGGGEIIFDTESGHPRFEWVDLRDFYIDPGLDNPSVDNARSIVRRKLFTVDQLDEMRDDPRMNIPPREMLTYMSRNPSFVAADKTKQISEAMRGVQFSPAVHESSVLPSERKVECLIYYSKYRIIWVLNRQWIAYNQQNPYGFIPFVFAPCFPFIGRFYAMSYSDVIENHQRYMEALYNARLDELSLAIRPPRVRKRGSILTPAQQRWSPGAVSEVDNPKEDIAILAPQGATADVMNDIAYLESSVEKMTGVNSVGMGVPRPGNANRTATGMNLQAQGGASRLWPIVKHIEDYLIVPMLYKMYRMVQIHSTPGQLLPALGQNDQYIQVGSEAFRQPVRFTITAASKMLTRDKLAQIVPFLAQYMLAGPFLQGIQAVGQTVDFEVLSQMLQDATGTGTMYKLIRPMNQQEMQMHQAPPPQVMMQQQQAQLDAQTRLQLMDKKVQGELQKTQLQKQTDPQQAQIQQQQAQQQSQQQAMQALLQLGITKQKASIDAQKAKQKLLFDHVAHQQQMAHARQQSQQQLQLEAAKNAAQLRQEREAHTQNLLLTALQGKQGLEQDAQAGQQKLSQAHEMGQHKMKMDAQKVKIAAQTAKAKAAARPKPAPKAS